MQFGCFVYRTTDVSYDGGRLDDTCVVSWRAGGVALRGIVTFNFLCGVRKVGGTNPKGQTNPKCLNARLTETCAETCFVPH